MDGINGADVTGFTLSVCAYECMSESMCVCCVYRLHCEALARQLD